MKRTFGVFDWAILAVLAFGIGLAGIGIVKLQKKNAPDVELEGVFCLPESEEGFPVQVGDEVRNENGTVLLGKVTEVSVTPVKKVFLRDGEAVYDRVEGLFQTEIIVEMTAKQSDGFRIGDLRVCAGGTGTYRIGDCYVANVRIASLQEGR